MRFFLFLIICWSVTFKTMAVNDSIPIMPTKHQRAFIPVLATSAALGLGLILDRPVTEFMRDHQSPFSFKVTNVTNLLGSKSIMVPALLTTFGSSFVLNNNKLKTTSWNSIKAVIMTSIAVEGLKISIGRARPFVNEGNSSFHPFNGNDIYKSMPSGHASFAFAIFTPFAETYSRWIYVIPTSVAIGRVYRQKHWLSDVMVGGGIGWLSGYLFTHSNKKIVVTPGGLVIWF